MVTIRVLKRDRRRERFSNTKLERSITSAAREAGMGMNQRKRLARDVTRDVRESLGRRSLISATELRRRVLGRLSRRSRSVVSAWRRYERRRR